jgi:hypothetical protein
LKTTNREVDNYTFLRLDGFLAGRLRNTFLEAIEKVLEGFVKNGGVNEKVRR